MRLTFLAGFIFVAVLPAHAQFSLADLALNTRITSPVFVAESITLAVEVRNLGPDYVASVNVENRLPEGSRVLFTSVVHPDGREFPGGCFVGTVGTLRGSVSCSVGTIAPQELATITIVFTSVEGEHVIRSWTFAGLSNDPNLTNNSIETIFAAFQPPAVTATSRTALALLIAGLCVIATLKSAAG